MTSLRSELEWLEADLAAVEDILAIADDDDVLTRSSMGARRDGLREQLAALKGQPVRCTAEASLVFGGRPVHGTHGIDAAFAGDAVTRFQSLVKTYGAAERHDGELSDSGRLPGSGTDDRLRIVGVVRGSFGFAFEEATSQFSFTDTPATTNVEAVAELMAATVGSEHEFEEAIESVDKRVASALSGLLETIHKAGATFRIESRHTRQDFDATRLDLACRRLLSVEKTTEHMALRARFLGVLPEGRRFEMRLESGDLISGRARASTATLLDYGRQYSGRDVEASVTKHTTRRANRETVQYVLEDIRGEVSPAPSATDP